MVSEVQKVKPVLRLSGKIVPGFGRGSKSLGVPTANLDLPDLQKLPLKNGVYFGWARLDQQANSDSPEPVRMMCCSYGNNPYFNNEMNTLEVHIIHDFNQDLYDRQLKIIVCGFIREQSSFASIEQLIERIHKDLELTKQSLTEKNNWVSLKDDHFFFSQIKQD